MGIFNWFMHRKMRNEAKKLAQQMPKLYQQSKARLGDASETDIIIGMIFKEDTVSNMSTQSLDKLKTCCMTVNGLCYICALDFGRLKGMINLRSLQFTNYMDIELENIGFPKQTREQKEMILNAMGLKIDCWE